MGELQGRLAGCIVPTPRCDYHLSLLRSFAKFLAQTVDGVKHGR